MKKISSVILAALAVVAVFPMSGEAQHLPNSCRSKCIHKCNREQSECIARCGDDKDCRDDCAWSPCYDACKVNCWPWNAKPKS